MKNTLKKIGKTGLGLLKVGFVPVAMYMAAVNTASDIVVNGVEATVDEVKSVISTWKCKETDPADGTENVVWEQEEVQ